jgi:hypothetical protein
LCLKVWSDYGFGASVRSNNRHAQRGPTTRTHPENANSNIPLPIGVRDTATPSWTGRNWLQRLWARKFNNLSTLKDLPPHFLGRGQAGESVATQACPTVQARQNRAVAKRRNRS